MCLPDMVNLNHCNSEEEIYIYIYICVCVCVCAKCSSIITVQITSALFDTDIGRVCPGDDLKLECPQGEVIVISAASFGRMKFTGCTLVDDMIGCKNDVLYLLDSWCSGRQSCQQNVPNKELKLANKNCKPYVSMYLELEYSCVKGNL